MVAHSYLKCILSLTVRKCHQITSILLEIQVTLTLLPVFPSIAGQQRKREFSIMLKVEKFEEQCVEHVLIENMWAHLQESPSCAGE